MPKSSNARKGTAEAASNAAASAFAATSNLQFADNQTLPPEQQGRRRLVDSYMMDRSRIVPDPDQPRQDFDEAGMTELTASVKARGILQPLTVRWNSDVSKFMVIDGGRRFEAATRLKLEQLPVWVQSGEGKGVLIDQIVHNWQRANLKPFETADALARLRDEFGLSQKQIGEVTGKSKSDISKFLALRDKVASDIQDVARGDNSGLMTQRHLYNLSRLQPDDQREVIEQVFRDNLSAAATEKLVQAHAGIAAPKPTRKKVRGIASRQKRFRTTEADVLITFRKTNFSNDDLRKVLHELRRLIDRGDD